MELYGEIKALLDSVSSAGVVRRGENLLVFFSVFHLHFFEVPLSDGGSRDPSPSFFSSLLDVSP